MGNIVTADDMFLVLGVPSSKPNERAIVEITLRNAESAVARFLRYDPVYRQRTEFYPQGYTSREGREGIWEANDTTAYLRTWNGSSSTELQTQNVPIRSVVTLAIDYDGRGGSKPGSFPAESLKTEGIDFWPNWDRVDSLGNKFCSDGILRSQGLWPDQPGSVKIVYFSGYKSDELRGSDSVINAGPIYETVMDEATRRFHKTISFMRTRLGFRGGPLTSENLGAYSYTVDSSILKGVVMGGDLSLESTERLNDFVNYGWSLSS